MSSCESSSSSNSEPATPATWYNTASDAVRTGVSDAQKSVESLMPKVSELFSKGLYNLGYGVGYGLTFPAVLISRSIPQENCATWGFVDGANMAHESAYRDKNETPVSAP